MKLSTRDVGELIAIVYGSDEKSTSIWESDEMQSTRAYLDLFILAPEMLVLLKELVEYADCEVCTMGMTCFAHYKGLEDLIQRAKELV